ncbi:MAG: mechanosensitive ion channel family protein [Lentisphaeria bacterium]
MLHLATNMNMASLECISTLRAFLQPMSDAMHSFWDSLYAHRINIFWMCLIFLATFLLTFLVPRITNSFLQIIFKKNFKNCPKSYLIKLRRSSSIAISITGLLLGILALHIPILTKISIRIYLACISIVVTWGLAILCDSISEIIKKKSNDKNEYLNDLLNYMLRRLIKTVIWCTGIIFIAQNVFGLNVNAILAGAGVLSLAVAFAAQNTIANIFGAISLILDKPFHVGELIEAGDKIGVVVDVGFRSTILRSLDGTIWYIPNKSLSEINIHNISKRPNFKQVFDIGLTYSMTAIQIQEAIDILHEILDNRPLFDMEKLPPRIFFSSMENWSLNINVMLWIQTADYFEMKGEMQKINLEILKRFNAAKLDFAFPSQTVYLKK